MTLSSNFVIRIQNLFLWLGAGLAFWWMRPTPETQLELSGKLVPPIPSDWVMVPYEGTLVRLYLCVFIGLAILYFWIGGWNQRGFSLIWTYIHTLFVFIAVNLGTDPVRIEWVSVFLHLFAEDGADQERIDFLQDAVGILFLAISGSMVVVAIKWKIDDLGDNYIHHL